jgi:transposase
MRPPRPIDEQAEAPLARLLRQAKTKADFQRVQCLWLRASLGLTHRQVARAVGWSDSRVKQIWSAYFKDGPQALRGLGRGGRRRQNLTLADEEKLLAGLQQTAQQGRILVVQKVQEAYEQAVGRTVPLSTVYRMLARHGWRKIMPRPRHPKNDPAKIEDFKKNSASCSAKKSPGNAGSGGPCA